MRILLVEDKIPLNHSLAKILRQERFAVDQAFDGQEALDLVDEGVHDLMILDLTLPRVDGLEVIRRLRADNVNLPILVLTARGGTREIVGGLQAGADDYLAKPFEFDELLARVRVLLRRQTPHASAQLRVDDLVLDTNTGEVWRDGKPVSLSRTEYNVLYYLMSKPQWIITKDELLTHVWSDDTAVYDRVVDTYICFLRKKIDRAFPDLPPLIHTVKTRGYKLGRQETPDENSQRE